MSLVSAMTMPYYTVHILFNLILGKNAINLKLCITNSKDEVKMIISCSGGGTTINTNAKQQNNTF